MGHPSKGLNKTVAQNMRRIRKERGISQIDLAKNIGVNTKTVGRLERMERHISLELLESIAVALEVEMEDLLYPPTKRLEDL